jgi:protein-arginine kinase activator protein McsA
MAGLRKRLETAIEEENYEEAARLRDRIRELENP